MRTGSRPTSATPRSSPCPAPMVSRGFRGFSTPPIRSRTVRQSTAAAWTLPSARACTTGSISASTSSRMPTTLWGEGGGWKAKGIGILNVNDCNETLAQIGPGEFGTWAAVAFNGSDTPTYSFNDDLMWTRGKHTFKGGYMYEFAPYAGGGQQYNSGSATFGAANTNLPNTSFTGLGFASFLLGQANGGSVQTPRWVDMRWRYEAMYFQDDWRVGARLTINLGVRYEFNLPPLIGGDKCSDFSPTTPNPGANGRLGALIFCGVGTGRAGSHTLAPGWYKGGGPGLGFSWNPQSKTVIRGGAGTTFTPGEAGDGTREESGRAAAGRLPDVTGG